MSRDHIDKLNPKRWMTASASGFYVVTDQFLERNVTMRRDIPEGQLSLPPTRLVPRFSPREARQIAEALQRKADTAEAELPQA